MIDRIAKIASASLLVLASLLLPFQMVSAAAQLPPSITPPAQGTDTLICYRSGVPKSCTVSQLIGFSTGTVSSVGLSMPGIFSVSGTPVTSTGTLTASLANQTKNTALMGPTSGSPAAPTFRQPSADDVTYTGSGGGGVAESVTNSIFRHPYPDQYTASTINTCSTDAVSAINAAFAATTYGPVYLHGCYKASSTVVVPSGRALVGDNFQFGNPIDSGSTRIVCDLTVTPCVQVGSGSSNGSASLRNLIVDRAAGTPGNTTVGVKVYDGYNVTLVDVFSHSHGVCFQALSHALTGYGLGIKATRIYSGACVVTHLDINSWPELDVEQSRFGMDGGGDYNATDFVRIQGGNNGTAGGPNTIRFGETQFNQGSNTVKYWFNYVNLNGSIPSIDADDIHVSDSHVEGITGAGAADIHSDSTWNLLNRLFITSTLFNDVGTAFFDLNAATGVSEVYIGNIQTAGNVTLAPTPQISSLTWTGGRIIGTTSITAAAGSTATFTGVNHGGNVTYAGSWGSLASIGESFTAGSMSVTGTGGISVIGALQTHTILGSASSGTPAIGTCGTSPAIDGRSTDMAGSFVTGSGTVNSCHITYAHAYPAIAWPVVTLGSNNSTIYWISGFDNTGFTVSFNASLPGTGFFYNVIAQ